MPDTKNGKKRLRPRVLTISKPYVAAAYRDKLRYLAAQGAMDIGLICPPSWGNQAFEESANDHTYWLRQVPIALNGKNHLHMYRGLERVVRAFAPTIMNIEEEHYSLVTWQAFRLARRLGARPIFYTWQNIAKVYPPPFAQIERYVFKHAAAAVVGNQEAADVLRHKGYRGVIQEIPQMGVSLERFAPAAGARDAARAHLLPRLGREALAVGFVGRLVSEKGGADLLRAVAWSGPNVHAVFVGDGPERPALIDLARTLGMGERAQFVPGVKSTDVPAWLHALDVLALPSHTRANWKEQFGRVLIEAMAAETVVVGSSSGEIPRVIGDAGCTFPEADAQALAACLKRLAASPAERADLTRRGAGRVRAKYTTERVASAFAELFQAVASGSENPGPKPPKV